MEFSDRADYKLYFRGKKAPWVNKDQARACHSGEKCGPNTAQMEINSKTQTPKGLDTYFCH